MAAIVVCGGGLIGLCAGLMLAEDGHGVTVLEPDPADPPGTPAAAWDDWRTKWVRKAALSPAVASQVTMLIKKAKSQDAQNAFQKPST